MGKLHMSIIVKGNVTLWISSIPEGTIANLLTDRSGSLDENILNGVVKFDYLNDQPSTTLWYHDHALGMTRLNVYAGPAGFWLIRDPQCFERRYRSR
jgi:hypothetical protein